MNPGFQNITLDVRTSDGLDDTLLEPLIFVRSNGDIIRAPIGSTTDGLSVPRCIQSFIPATGGDWFASVLHDAGYRNQLQIAVDEKHWILAKYNQKECDDLMREAMKAQNTGWKMRFIIYWSVRLFGKAAFDDDRILNP